MYLPSQNFLGSAKGNEKLQSGCLVLGRRIEQESLRTWDRTVKFDGGALRRYYSTTANMCDYLFTCELASIGIVFLGRSAH
jgi:hypothetical protein